MLSELTGALKKPKWCDIESILAGNEDAISVSQANMVCATCGYKWRQCEVAKGYAGITSECPKCGGKCERGSMVEHAWAPAHTLIVWSELPA